MKLEEQETTISYSRDFNNASIWTSDRTIINKLDKLCIKNPSDYKLLNIGRSINDNEILCKEYSVPKEYISFRTRKPKRTVTDIQRAEMRMRAKALHDKH